MGGWFLDVLAVYLFKVVVFWFRSRGSVSWPSVTATVTAAYYNPSGGLGCDTAEIAYSYRLGDESYTGMYERPFLAGSAKDYVARFSVGNKLTVHVKPGNPDMSVVRDEDALVLVPASGVRN